MELSGRTRSETLKEVESTDYDLVIIGGGITGCAVAHDAALRGMRTLLLEKNDWAFGTSSRSSKLAHGGLRYLEMFEFKLVFEACRERRRLLMNAPHLTWPQPFLFPVYKGDKNGLFMIGAGLWLYDILALFRNVQNHKMHGRKRILEVEPELDRNRLKGGGQFFDCATDDARLTLAFMKSAHVAGSDCINYGTVIDINHERGRASGVRFKDNLTGKEYDVGAKIIANATGPWTDIICKMDEQDIDEKLRPTKGSHIVVSRKRLPVINAMPIISPEDQRMMFIIPWGECALVGTTDTDYDDDFDIVRASGEDVAYIIEAANRAIPSANLTTDDVISTYAGLRPLIEEGGGSNVAESKVSREHRIYRSHTGMLTIAGGKLTTARSMAQEMVDEIAGNLADIHGKKMRKKCGTKHLPLYGAGGDDMNEWTDRKCKELNISESVARSMYLWGSEATSILRMCAIDESLAEPLAEGISYIGAEVIHSVKSEMALTLTDFMVRRSQIFYIAPDQGLECIDKVADLMAKEIGWSEKEKKDNIDCYRAEVEMSRAYKKELR